MKQDNNVQPLTFKAPSVQKKKFSELVDFKSLQSLLDYFYEVVGIADAIIDLDAVVLLGSGWQDTCTKYHRIHPTTCARCIESDTSLVTSMMEGEEYAIYRCPNGLVDAAAPIKIEGEHVANFFLGQFFLAPPDLDFFRKQAAEFGFDEKSYLEAVARVPIASEKQVRFIMNFLVRLTEVFGEMGLQQIQLNEALTSLEAHDKLKDEFLANTSHELRTPLNGIIGIAESLIDGVAGEMSGQAKNNLTMIAGSGKRLSSLVNDILDFSKLKHQDIELQLKPIALREIVDVVLTLSQTLVAKKSVKLINEIPADLPAALADENRLQQILYNLVGNAIKFTENGYIKVSVQIIEQQLQIVVADTGIGIPADKLERIFESFEQASGSTAREYGGTGLGLAVTKKLVELHSGKIWVESTVNKGSQFVLTLPIAEEKAAPLAMDKRHLSKLQTVETDKITVKDEALDGKFNILIVDDEPVNLQVLHNYLSLQNYHIVQAVSGPEALDFIANGFKPDAILLDVMMPKMTGYEVTQKLREKWSIDELPILLLTAKNQITDLVTGLKAGASDYLTKPISKDELLARLKTHLHIKELQIESIRLAAVEERNKIMMESIQYAKVIQSSLLPDAEQVKTYIPNNFLIWMPRDIVGGDMVYAEQVANGFIVAAIDCTGHGVPGAFMTMIVSTNLRRIIREQVYLSPAEILKQLNFLVKTSLQQDTEYAKSDDGLDISICLVQADILTFAGARLPLYYIHNNQLTMIKGNKQSLGYRKSDVNSTFTNHTVKIEADMAFYLSTDGFTDQLGGDKHLLFGKKRFKKILLENYQLPFAKQSQALLQAFNEYKGDNDRQDDVTVIGFGI
ncbi:PocR ligand-binding domain-containing protein [Candidatus Halobeggiatoa sp. HSG11]|nr:PocR ligand-binding domain-containing protein [Candidatus Halobeggiatoa sp. HSG11]